MSFSGFSNLFPCFLPDFGLLQSSTPNHVFNKGSGVVMLDAVYFNLSFLCLYLIFFCITLVHPEDLFISQAQ